MLDKNVFDWKKNLISGLLVGTPIFLSIAIVWWLLNLLTGSVQDVVVSIFPGLKDPESEAIPFWLKIILQLSIITSYILILYLIGILTRNLLGKEMLNVWDRFVNRIPFLRTIYSTVKQITSTILDGNRTQLFSKVVLVEYPSQGLFMMGFLTGSGTSDMRKHTNCDTLRSVFLPTTPNPTSGFLVYLEESKIKVLDLSITEGMQLIISGGAVMPNSVNNNENEIKNNHESSTASSQ